MARVYYYVANFVTSTGRWQSPVVDLYANSAYTNYSSTKSNYGANLLGTGVWTGLSEPDDAGYVTGSRWVDLTGSIDLVSFTVNTSSASPYSLTVYSTPSSSDHFPDEWFVTPDLLQTDGINLDNADRYAVFALDFAPSIGTVSGTLTVRVEIGEPTMGPFYRATQTMLNQFPEWMAIRELENVNAATPSLPGTTPLSIGGQLLNALAGEYLEDLSNELIYTYYQRFIDTVDLTQMAWCYTSAVIPIYPSSFMGDGIELTRCLNFRDFTESLPTEDTCYWDENKQTVYTNKVYSLFKINRVTAPQQLFAVWNYVDELGLLVDLSRLSGEDNATFRLRIKDVFVHLPGAGLEQFKTTLRRELNIWAAFGVAPNSSYVGATPTILEIPDIEKDSDFVTPEGLPTSRFETLVDKLSYEYPSTWGRFIWDQAVWDIGGPNYVGFSVLSNRFDATPVSEDYFQSGVGDGDDLRIYRPDVILGPHDFESKLTVQGQKKIYQTHYPEVDIDCLVYGQGDRIYYNNPTQFVWLSLEVNYIYTPQSSATPNIRNLVASFQVQVTSDIDIAEAATPNATPSSASYANVKIFNSAGLINRRFHFIDPITGKKHFGDLNSRLMNSVALRAGQWDVSSQTYINVPPTDTFAAWFSDNTSNVLTYNTPGGNAYLAPATPPVIIGNPATPNFMNHPSLVVMSKVTAATPGTWTSPKFPYHVTLDGLTPDLTTKSYNLPMPSIIWDPYVSTPGYVIELVSSNQPNDNTADHDLTNSISPLMGGNLLSNHSFEENLDGWISSANCGLGRESVWAHHGVWSMSLTSHANGAMSAQSYPVPINPLVRILATAWFMPHVAGGVAENIHLELLWFDSNYSPLSNTVGSAVTEILNTPTQATVEGLAPNSTAYVALKLVVESTTAHSIHLVDKVKLSVGSTQGTIATTGVSTKGGWTTDANNKALFLPYNYIYLNNSNSWNYGRWQEFPKTSSQITVSSGTGSLYPIPGYIWQYYEAEQATPYTGLVDQNGPWSNDLIPNYGNSDYRFATVSPTRADFGVPETTDYYLTGIGIKTINDPQVVSWLGSNVITPAFDQFGDTPAFVEGTVLETYSGGVYKFSPFNIYVRLDPNPSPNWNPQINTGYFYEGDDEYYVFVDPFTEAITSSSQVLQGVSRQGAPIIVWTNEATPRLFRQVAFFNPSATPITLGLINTETLSGNGTNNLYLAYEDIYNITVEDVTASRAIGATTLTSSNVISLNELTDPTHLYSVSYVVNNSFYATNDYVSVDTNSLRTVLTFDRSPSQLGVANYLATYETSTLNPATPIDITLNPTYTSLNEGFIFLSHKEYPIDKVLIYLTPASVTANGEDYILITLRTVDAYDNPKPYQTVDLSSSWGSLSNSHIVTNIDGFGYTTLNAVVGTTSTHGTITATGGTTTTVGFTIVPEEVEFYTILGQPNVYQIPSDLVSQVAIHGVVQDSTHQVVPHAIITWKKARSLYEIFAPSAHPTTGTVTANSAGAFDIGPFSSATPPGYWILSMETTGPAGGPSFPQTGDVTFWYEYPTGLFGVESANQIALHAIQMSTPASAMPSYSGIVEFPVDYDESITPPATPVTVNWLPPKWFPLSRYVQYQLGLMGNDPADITPSEFGGLHPSSEDI